MTDDQHHQTVSEEILYMATCVFSPSSFKSRYNKYFQFENYISNFKNVILYTIEVAIKDQNFTVTDPNNPRHIQIKTDKPLWYKENILNILINKFPPDAKNIAWVDCDVQWDNENWAVDTIKALKEYPVVQMFSTWQNLDENDKPSSDILFDGFGYRWVTKTQTEKYPGFTGLAWAARRDIFESMGGLIDWGILGSGDYYMANAMVGINKTDVLDVDKQLISDPNTFVGSLDITLNKWIAKADIHIQRNIGYVAGNIKHFFHGKKSERGYNWRWQILVNYKYSPLKNITYRDDGLIKVIDLPEEFFSDVSNYFDSRHEDYGLPLPLVVAAE